MDLGFCSLLNRPSVQVETTPNLSDTPPIVLYISEKQEEELLGDPELPVVTKLQDNLGTVEHKRVNISKRKEAIKERVKTG